MALIRRTKTDFYQNVFKDQQTGGITASDMRDFTKSVFSEVADRAPEKTDDATNGGFDIGDTWKDTNNDLIWICFDNTDGNADWRSMLVSDTGGFSFEDIMIDGHKIKGISEDGLQLLDSSATGTITVNQGITLESSQYGITIIGDLYQSSGTSFVTESEKVRIYDNLAVLNKGEVGSGVTEGFAGWEIDRGILTPFRWGFDESTDLFKVGKYYEKLTYSNSSLEGSFQLNEKIVDQESSATAYIFAESTGVTETVLSVKEVNGTFSDGDTIVGQDSSASAVLNNGPIVVDDMQANATREENPIIGGIPYWDNESSLFATSSGMTFTSGVTFHNYLIVGDDSDIDKSDPVFDFFLEGDARFGSSGLVQSTNYASGWDHRGGFRLYTGQYDPTVLHSKLTIDELTVRDRMKVYELLINQIRATNGSLFVTSAAKVESVSSGSTVDYLTFEDVTEKGVVPFLANDILMGTILETDQAVDDGTGNVIYDHVVGTVNSIDGLTVEIDWVTSPEDQSPDNLEDVIGSTFARIGNLTDTDRMGSIYLTSDDDNSPYIDIKDEVSSYNDWDVNSTKIRIGRMNGLPISVFDEQPTGFGLYGSRIYLATSGDTDNYIKIRADETNSVIDMAYDGESIFKFDSSAQTAMLSNWMASSAHFYSLSSGEPTASPAGGVVLDSGFHGIKGYDSSGNVLFKLGDENNISGFIFNQNHLSKEIDPDEVFFGNYNAGEVHGLVVENSNDDNVVNVGRIESTDFGVANTSAVTMINGDFDDGSPDDEWSFTDTGGIVSTHYYDPASNPDDKTNVGGVDTGSNALFLTVDTAATSSGEANATETCEVTYSDLDISDTNSDGTTYYFSFKKAVARPNELNYLRLDDVRALDPDRFEGKVYIYGKQSLGDSYSLIKSKNFAFPAVFKLEDAEYSDWYEESFYFSCNSDYNYLKLQFDIPLFFAYKNAYGSEEYYQHTYKIDSCSLTACVNKTQLSQDGLYISLSPEHYIKIAPNAVADGYFADVNTETFNVENTSSFKGDITVDNNVVYETEDFSSDLHGGYGGKIGDSGTGDFDIHCDNLYVRNALRAHEYAINKIRTSNGSFMVANAAKIADIDDTNDVILLRDSDNIGSNPFEVNDIVYARSAAASNNYNVEELAARVTGIGTVDSEDTNAAYRLDVTWVQTPTSYDDFRGAVLTQVGNTSNSDRQGSILLTSDFSNSPYISIYDGVSSYTAWKTPETTKALFGNLDSLSHPLFDTMGGYGMYGSRIYLATSGDTDNYIKIRADENNSVIDMAYEGNSIFKFDSSAKTATLSSWVASSAHFYSLSSGEPNNAPQGGVVLDHDFHGIKGYDSSGNLLFKLGDDNQISGFEFNNQTLYSKGSSGVVALSSTNIWSSDLWSDSSAELLMYVTDGGTPALWLKDDKSSGHVGMYWLEQNDWGFLGQDSSGNEVFHLGSDHHVANWNFDSSGIYKTSNNRTIGLRSDTEQALYVKDQYDEEIISVGTLDFPSTSAEITIPDSEFENDPSTMAWTFDLASECQADVNSGYNNNASRIYVDTSGLSLGEFFSNNVYQTHSLSAGDITEDDTVNVAFYIYGDEENIGYRLANQTVDLVVTLYDGVGGSQTKSKTDINIGFQTWKQVKLTMGANFDVDSIKIEIKPSLYYSNEEDFEAIKGSCKIDTLSVYKSVRDVTLNDQGLQIFSTPNEYVSLTKDGLDFFGNEVQANSISVLDSVEIYGKLIVHGESDVEAGSGGDYTDVVPADDNQYKLGSSDKRWRQFHASSAVISGDLSTQDIIPDTHDTYILGSSEKKWAEINAADANIGGLYESGMKTKGIEDCPVGTVVIWDDGKLKPCAKARDKNVQGVSNKKPEPIVMGAEPVRIIGKISEGDFVVTSKTEGCGRKLKWYERLLPNRGCIIGQALEDKNSQEEGLVKVMIRKM
jgi:hypothetical protein